MPNASNSEARKRAAERHAEPGLEARYRVEKINDLEGKHSGCRYFVLDPQHDPHARAAALAYADSCEADHPRLADDLRRVVAYVEVREEVDHG